jgi:hypothetical protein
MFCVTTIICLCNINGLVFIMQADCVLSEMLTCVSVIRIIYMIVNIKVLNGIWLDISVELLISHASSQNTTNPYSSTARDSYTRAI